MSVPVLLLPSQDRLLDILYYDAATGVFTWKKPRTGGIEVGSVAGTIDKNGYRRIQIDKVRYLAHRLVFGILGEPVPDEVDHRNRNRDDNRRLNLRPITHPNNCKNSKLSSANTTGCTGVYWRKDVNKFVAKIHHNYRAITLGFFVNKTDAIAARKAAEPKYGFTSTHGS